MPTRNISLTQQQDAFVQKVVESGEYQNASEAIRAGLRELQLRRQENALKLKALRAQVRQGLKDLDAGRAVELSLDELEPFLNSLTATPPKRARRR